MPFSPFALCLAEIKFKEGAVYLLALFLCISLQAQIQPPKREYSGVSHHFQWGIGLTPAYYSPAKTHDWVEDWINSTPEIGGTFRLYLNTTLDDHIVLETGLGMEAIPYHISVNRTVNIPNTPGPIVVNWDKFSYSYSNLQIPVGLSYHFPWYKNRAPIIGLGMQAKLFRNVREGKVIEIDDFNGQKITVLNLMLSNGTNKFRNISPNLAIYGKAGMQWRNEAKTRQMYVNGFLQIGLLPVASTTYTAQDENILSFGWINIHQHCIGLEMGIGFNKKERKSPQIQEEENRKKMQYKS